MKIIIIGGQAAGASAAAKARRMLQEYQNNETHTNKNQNHEKHQQNLVRIYEKGNIVSFGACGLPYFIGNQFTDPQEMISRTPAQLQKTGIDVKTNHEVIALNQQQKTLTIKNLTTGDIFCDEYDKLLIATGASPLPLKIAGVQLANIFSLKTLADGQAIKALMSKAEIRQVAIIGAGYIGLEMADNLLAAGKQVIIFEQAASVLPGAFDTDISRILEQEIRQHCQLQLNETVQVFKGDQQHCVSAVCSQTGDYPVQAVIVATGVRPVTDIFQHQGITTLDNGAIVTDEYGQTNIRDIYAAGDCAAVLHQVSQQLSYIPLATSANKMGKLIGENLAGAARRYTGTLGSSGLAVFAIEAARTGINEKEAEKLGISYKSVLIKDKNHSNYLSGQADIWLKLTWQAESRILLGAQIVGGAGAALRINTLALAIWQKMVVDDLAMVDFLYAPPFSRPWDIMNIAGGAAKSCC